MKKNSWFGLAVVIAVTTVAVFTLFLKEKKARTASNGEVVIKVVVSATTPNVWEIAQKLTGKDILKEEGVEIEQIPSIAGATSFQALLTGVCDVAGGHWSGWINVAARGGKLRAVYSNSAITKAFKDRGGILVLQNSSIHTVKDLKGKTIGVNVLGLGGENVIKILLEKNGLSLRDVQLLVVPDTNNEQVLRTKQVDALAGTTNGGIWFDRAVARGGVRKIPGSSEYEVCGPRITSASGFREDFIKAHPDVVRRYVTAIEKAKRIIWNEFQKNPKKVQTAYAEIAVEKGGNPENAQFYLPTDPESSFMRDKDVQFWIDALVSEGKIKPGQVKPSDIYTNEFNPFYKDSVKEKK
jgi:ABC-type nitrate/sulfonate/bicarbonate transport system substrate-binding protein